MSLLENIRRKADEFFYAEEVPYGLALCRIAICLTVFVIMAVRWPMCRELYSSDGAPAPLAVGYGYDNLLPELPGAAVVALFTLMLFCTLTAAAGWMTRASLVAVCVLYSYFNLMDCVTTVTKYSVIATHVLVLLACSGCGKLWSVDAWLALRRRGPGRSSPLPPTAPVWPARLLQIMIGVVYFGASITKLHTATFFSGDQLLWWMITDMNYAHPLGYVLAEWPLVLSVMCYVAVVWEMTFLFVVWKPWMRVVYLALGVVFHAMTYFTLGLLSFPCVCISAYLAFGGERECLALARRAKAAWARVGLAGRLAWAARLARTPAARLPRFALRAESAAVFGVVAVAVTTMGMATEHRLDRYGVRRPEGRHTLAKADPAAVERLLANNVTLRPEDKFFSVRIGKVLVGDSLMGESTVYRKGEKVITQCRLVPPHEDMYVECLIYDADNHVVHRMSNVAAREAARLSFTYWVESTLEPGDYVSAIRAGGREIAHRPFTVVE